MASRSLPDAHGRLVRSAVGLSPRRSWRPCRSGVRLPPLPPFSLRGFSDDIIFLVKLAEKYRKAIRNISRALERDYAPERIVLFGSYAEGRQKAESDIDLLIVKRTSQPFYKRLEKVRKIVSPVRVGIPFDPIVVTPQELTARLELGDQFLGDILRSGKTLYAKP